MKLTGGLAQRCTRFFTRLHLRTNPICAQDVTRRWSGALEKNKPRRLASTYRRSWRDRDNYRPVEYLSDSGNFGDDPATGNALGFLERNLLPDSLRLL